MKDLIEVTENEKKAIQQIGEMMARKWSHRTASKENLQEFAYEVTSRYAELGFLVNVDITPALVGIAPPDVALVGRITPMEVDHDRVRHEVRKEYKEKGKL